MKQEIRYRPLDGNFTKDLKEKRSEIRAEIYEENWKTLEDTLLRSIEQKTGLFNLLYEIFANKQTTPYIISEDSSGRILARILKSVLELINSKQGIGCKITILSYPVGRDSLETDTFVSKIRKQIGDYTGDLILTTDFVDTGSSLKPILSQLENKFRILKMSGKEKSIFNHVKGVEFNVYGEEGPLKLLTSLKRDQRGNLYSTESKQESISRRLKTEKIAENIVNAFLKDYFKSL